MASLMNKKSKGLSQSARAGLIFPVGRVGRILRRGRFSGRVASTAPVYLAAVMEYMCREVFDVATHRLANCTKRVRLKPRDIFLAVVEDSEMKEFMGSALLTQAGVVESVHPLLLPQKQKNKPALLSAPTAVVQTRVEPQPEMEAKEDIEPKVEGEVEPEPEPEPEPKVEDEVVADLEAETEVEPEVEDVNTLIDESHEELESLGF